MLTLTSAIMDYQYKSINRGENSIFGQIEKEGIDPRRKPPRQFISPTRTNINGLEYIFVFNLRSYDRVNFTPAMKKQEEKSGVRYQELQRAEAEEIMGSGIHGAADDSSSSSEGGFDDDSGDEERERLTDRKRKFEAQREAAGLKDEKVPSKDSIAEDAMLDEGKPSKEPWDDGDEDSEKNNFVQEELYIHGKVLIVDDKTVVVGSSNINDRVSRLPSPLRLPLDSQSA